MTVASILPFIRAGKGAAFDDAVTRAMGDAFEEVLKALQDKGQPPVVREVIAARIIEAASRGERDVSRLRDAALAGLTDVQRPA